MPDGNVVIDVRRAVERVDGNREARSRVEQNGIFQFFRGVACDGRALQRRQELVVAQDVAGPSGDRHPLLLLPWVPLKAGASAPWPTSLRMSRAP